MTEKQAEEFRAEVMEINDSVGTKVIHVGEDEFEGVSKALGLDVEDGCFWVKDYCGVDIIKIVKWSDENV